MLEKQRQSESHVAIRNKSAAIDTLKS